MNARGMMELILLNIGLQRGLITPTLFTMLVMMAIGTTLMACPLFCLVYGRQRSASHRTRPGCADGYTLALERHRRARSIASAATPPRAPLIHLPSGGHGDAHGAGPLGLSLAYARALDARGIVATTS